MVTNLYLALILGIAFVIPKQSVSQSFEPSLTAAELPATVVDIIVGGDVHTTLAAAVVAADTINNNGVFINDAQVIIAVLGTNQTLQINNLPNGLYFLQQPEVPQTFSSNTA